MEKALTPEALERAGRALFPGEHWRFALRDALGGINDRPLRRWLAGSVPIPDGIAASMRELVAARRDELSDILREMEGGQ